MSEHQSYDCGSKLPHRFSFVIIPSVLYCINTFGHSVALNLASYFQSNIVVLASVFIIYKQFKLYQYFNNTFILKLFYFHRKASIGQRSRTFHGLHIEASYWTPLVTSCPSKSSQPIWLERTIHAISVHFVVMVKCLLWPYDQIIVY